MSIRKDILKHWAALNHKLQNSKVLVFLHNNLIILIYSFITYYYYWQLAEALIQSSLNLYSSCLFIQLIIANKKWYCSVSHPHETI